MLPILPQLTNDNKVNIDLLYRYLQQLSLSFANAAGFAIDPSIGEGGDAALTITEPPTGVTYTPTSSFAIDGSLLGAIDITFVKPDRAVGIIVYYREQGVTNYKQSYAFSSPFRLINLKAGVSYQLQLTGQAANGNISEFFSTLTSVTIAAPMHIVLGSKTLIAEEPDYTEPFVIIQQQGLRGLQGPPGLTGQQGSSNPSGLDADESVYEPVALVRDLPAVGRIPTVLDNLSAFSSTTSAQLASVISDETGSGLLVFGTTPTLGSPIIANIVPGANFTLTQNGTIVLTSEEAAAVVNTLYLKQGKIGIGTNTPAQSLDIGGAGARRVAVSGGTVITTGDWALTSGWGANATISAVSGNDVRGRVTVTTSAIDTPTVNPIITLTFKDGTWTTAPFAVADMNITGTGPMGAASCDTTPTTLAILFVGTPTAVLSRTYTFNYLVIG